MRYAAPAEVRGLLLESEVPLYHVYTYEAVCYLAPLNRLRGIEVKVDQVTNCLIHFCMVQRYLAHKKQPPHPYRCGIPHRPNPLASLFTLLKAVYFAGRVRGVLSSHMIC